MSDALARLLPHLAQHGRELEDQIVRENCRESLHEFVKEFWFIIEPGRHFVDNWHLRWICAELEAITEGRTIRLLMNVPPGAMKSLLVSVFWPAWEWGPRRLPHLRYLLASYSQDLTIRDNRRCKAILSSPKYQRLWPEMKLDPRRDSTENFGNMATGWRIATSTGGVGTGERCDRLICFPERTMVYTDLGYMRIGDVVRKRLPVRVAGWDGRSIVWQSIEAWETNPGRRLYRITHESGSIECTGDHRIWVDGRGYIAASDVQVGETLRTYGIKTVRPLRDDDIRQTEPSSEAEVVLSGVSGQRRDGRRAGGELTSLPHLREDGLSPARSWRPDTERPLLQSRVPRGVEPGREEPNAQGDSARGLCVVQEVFQKAAEKARMLLSAVRDCPHTQQDGGRVGGQPHLPALQFAIHSQSQSAEVLFEDMRGCGSLGENEARGQRSLCAWSVGQTVSGWMDEDIQGADQNAGYAQMPTLRDAGGGTRSGAGRASHQLPEGGPGCVEPDHSMPFLSREDARLETAAGELGRSVVLAVEITDEHPDNTFNVRVTPCHNYFADGVLVHNCDDPHSVRTADSEAIRDQTLHWWREVVPTRVNDPQTSAFVVIMQRVHEDDVSGDILDNRGPEWVHVMVPMRYEPERHCVTNQGEDPRTIEGELYWPERFPDWTVERDSIPLGRFGVAAQFQQMPAPRGGGIIRDQDWRPWPPVDEIDKWIVERDDGPPVVRFPPWEFMMAYLDTAFTSKEENAYCALIRFGVFADTAGRPKIMMAQAWQDRPTLRQLCVKVLETCERGRVDVLVIENRAGAEWVKQEIMALMRSGEFSIVLDEPRGDKVARLHSVGPLFEDGVVHAPDRTWADMVIKQVGQFPKGKFKDLVDCLSGGLGYLRRNGLIKLGAEHDEDERESRVWRGKRETAADRYGVG